MKHDHPPIRRRDFLRRSASLGAAIPVLATFAPRGALAGKPKLDPRAPNAQSLGYAHDGSDTERPSADQSCSQCVHFGAVGNGAWGNCNVFPESLVNADGWCSAFVAGG